MALARLPYKTLQHLVGPHLSTTENPSTEMLIKSLSGVRKRGYLTRPELIAICRWKSVRAIRHIRRNRTTMIRNVTRAAFRTRGEQKRTILLTSLHGVGIPMASAILMLTNPSRYGVIDIRVWQLLFKMGAVTTNANGVGFDFKQWHSFLVIIRYFASKYKVKARDIERTLFNVHSLYQEDVLYNN